MQLLAAGAKRSRAAGLLPASTQLPGEPVLRQHWELSTQPTQAGCAPPPLFASTSNILMYPRAGTLSFSTAPSVHAQPKGDQCRGAAQHPPPALPLRSQKLVQATSSPWPR